MTFFLGFDCHILHFLQLKKLLLFFLQLLFDFLFILLHLNLFLLFLLLLNLISFNISLLFIELSKLLFVSFSINFLRFRVLVCFVSMTSGGGIIEPINWAFHFFNDLNIITILTKFYLSFYLIFSFKHINPGLKIYSLLASLDI